MIVVRDEPKRQANLVKHGLDFGSLTFEFFLEARIVTAKGGRFQALGMFDGRAVVVIFSRHGIEALSVISLRPASVAERNQL